jgi:hypothetical protein
VGAAAPRGARGQAVVVGGPVAQAAGAGAGDERAERPVAGRGAREQGDGARGARPGVGADVGVHRIAHVGRVVRDRELDPDQGRMAARWQASAKRTTPPRSAVSVRPSAG